MIAKPQKEDQGKVHIAFKQDGIKLCTRDNNGGLFTLVEMYDTAISGNVGILLDRICEDCEVELQKEREQDDGQNQRLLGSSG